MADTDAALEVRDPDALVNEIERTRENLARTIDAIAGRVNPATNARKAMDRVREQVSQIDMRYVAVGGAVVVGTVALLIWRRRK
jgi:Protein of unknown function (DUF3618)